MEKLIQMILGFHLPLTQSSKLRGREEASVVLLGDVGGRWQGGVAYGAACSVLVPWPRRAEQSSRRRGKPTMFEQMGSGDGLAMVGKVGGVSGGRAKGSARGSGQQ